MRRDGRKSWFHELDGLGNVIRALPPPSYKEPLNFDDDKRAEAIAKRERRAAKRRPKE